MKILHNVTFPRLLPVPPFNHKTMAWNQGPVITLFICISVILTSPFSPISSSQRDQIIRGSNTPFLVKPTNSPSSSLSSLALECWLYIILLERLHPLPRNSTRRFICLITTEDGTKKAPVRSLATPVAFLLSDMCQWTANSPSEEKRLQAHAHGSAIPQSALLGVLFVSQVRVDARSSGK